jgi:hypothetical protein
VLVLALAGAGPAWSRNAGYWLLLLWVAGTFVFAAFFNWTVNGRSILPMTPALGILIARRLEQNFPAHHPVWLRGAAVCLAASAALSLLVARSDYQLACAARDCARQACAQLTVPGKTLWFEGHWGFQYYMEAGGARAIDLEKPALESGDIYVVPANNANLRCPQLDHSHPRDIITVPKSHFLATMDGATGAGFYANVAGPLPFAFGRVAPEMVAVFDFNGLVH